MGISPTSELGVEHRAGEGGPTIFVMVDNLQNSRTKFGKGGRNGDSPTSELPAHRKMKADRGILIESKKQAKNQEWTKFGIKAKSEDKIWHKSKIGGQNLAFYNFVLIKSVCCKLARYLLIYTC